jgi:hypothetical protein
VLRAITATVRELTDSDAVHISLPEADSALFRVYALDFFDNKVLKIKADFGFMPRWLRGFDLKRDYATLSPA